MASEPWKKWIPGVLSKKQVNDLFLSGYIQGKKSLDESSFDLRLKNEAYSLQQGSVKPWGPHFFNELKNGGLIKEHPKKNGEFLLKSGSTYLFKLNEQFSYPQELSKAGIYGQATAKSSVGRVDVLARLIVDGMECYEMFNPDGIGKGSGEMFLEVTPTTFDVRVKPGISLSQLRLFYGKPEDVEIHGKEICNSVLNEKKGEFLSVDLSTVQIGNLPTSAFSADQVEKGPRDSICLWKTKTPPDPCPFWRLTNAKRLTGTLDFRLQMEKGRFYILRSKEKISVPPGIAVYCKAIDETIGEMRIHYAGFVHPWFGWKRADDVEGTPLIFEVRVHGAGVNLKDGEQLARLYFYRMSDDAKKPKQPPAYGEQTLKLSNFFAPWPEELEDLGDGKVKAK